MSIFNGRRGTFRGHRTLFIGRKSGFVKLRRGASDALGPGPSFFLGRRITLYTRLNFKRCPKPRRNIILTSSMFIFRDARSIW